jgi:uncharacterized cupin superfamily protein
MSKKLVRMSKEGPEGKGLKQGGVTELGKLVAGNPVEASHNYFTDKTGKFMTGVWECQKGTLKLTSYPFDEFCHILKGEVHITDQRGNTEIFKKGDTFTIAKGFKGTWHMPKTVRKFYTIFLEQDGK